MGVTVWEMNVKLQRSRCNATTSFFSAGRCCTGFGGEGCTVERMWHICDSQALIMALAFRSKPMKPFNFFSLLPLLSEVAEVEVQYHHHLFLLL